MADAGALPRVVRAYEAQRALRGRARRVTEAIADGFFLGLMDRDDLAALDRAFYAAATEAINGRGRRYDEDEHIRSGLEQWEADAVHDHLPPRSRVVVTSAGAGREVLALRALGFDAIGYEPNERLVAAGRCVLEADGHPAALYPCARDSFPTTQAADAVVIGAGAYTLIQGAARRIELLRGARRVLAAGSPLLVSYFTRPPLRYFRIVHGVGAPLRRLRGGETLEHGDALSPNFVHYFTTGELQHELAAAGFEVTEHRPAPYAHTIAHAV